jgi:hypothetical protein
MPTGHHTIGPSECTVSRTRVGVFAALTIVALWRPLAAQQTPVTLGQWVRVVSLPDSTIHQGRLLLVLTDTVALGHGEHTEFRALGRAGRLEVPTHLRRHVLGGGLVGAGIGMVIAALLPEIRATLLCPGFDCPATPNPAIGPTGRVALGGAVGLVIGAIIGAHTYTTRWDPVPQEQLDRLRVGLMSQPGGQLGLGASLAF